MDPQHDHSHPPAKPFTRLGQLLRYERRDIAAIIAFALGVGVLSLATPIAVETLVNTVAFGVLMWPVLVICAVLVGCLGLAAAIRAVQTYTVECLQRRLFVRVVADYSHRLPRTKIAAFDREYGPEFANRFFDVMNVQKSLAFLLLDGIALVVTVVVGMTVLAFYHPFLLGFDLVMLTGIAILLFVLGRGGTRTALQESRVKYDVAAWLQELARNPGVFQSTSGQNFAVQRAEALASEYISARKAHFRVVWRQTLFGLALQVIFSSTLLGLGAYLVINRQLTLGQLVAAELIVALVVGSVAKLGKFAETFYDLLAGCEKLGILTDLPLNREGEEQLPGVGPLAVDAQDFHVSPGERIAVVGTHNSGKFTLFEILCGYREPELGTVELNGQDIRHLVAGQLHERVALVEGREIVQGTILENLRFGNEDLSLGEIRKALEIVELTEVLRGLPAGLDTRLTPDGNPLSGVHTRRLLIARAIVRRPGLLILDGVLDLADCEGDSKLADFLFDPNAPWTLLISSANPQMISRCARVVPWESRNPFERGHNHDGH